MDRLTLAFVFCLAAIPVGILGAGAFNPDDGWLVRNEPLWSVFGLYGYFGMLGGWAVALYLLAVIVRGKRSGLSPGLRQTP